MVDVDHVCVVRSTGRNPWHKDLEEAADIDDSVGETGSLDDAEDFEFLTDI